MDLIISYKDLIEIKFNQESLISDLMPCARLFSFIVINPNIRDAIQNNKAIDKI
tara:strand:- start:62 stop:223 length:162 start_codon:yes stop_codon:yes gene_type:complete